MKGYQNKLLDALDTLSDEELFKLEKVIRRRARHRRQRNKTAKEFADIGEVMAERVPVESGGLDPDDDDQRGDDETVLKKHLAAAGHRLPRADEEGKMTKYWFRGDMVYVPVVPLERERPEPSKKPSNWASSILAEHGFK